MNEYVAKLEKERDEALAMLREVCMRCQIMPPQNNEDRVWFTEGFLPTKPIFQKLLKVLDIGGLNKKQ